jgi:RHH-type proline utilization regulon transcriptional repressor/proline dehydrogenase/delta 1-pyrroline-5-carboxylate dehydrogenase
MMNKASSKSLIELRSAINHAYLQDEQQAISDLLQLLQDYPSSAISAMARELITTIRNQPNSPSLIAAFTHEYQLDSDEGVILLEIAEALLRIPDNRTQDLFLLEKLSAADWQAHFLNSHSLLVNFSTGALMLAGLLEGYQPQSQENQQQIINRLCSRLGAPIIRNAIKQGMQLLAYQFVIAENITDAIHVSQQHSEYRYSFDMLGEAAITAEDSEFYFQEYLNAIHQLSNYRKPAASLFENPGISVKLSALCPRYEPLQRHRAIKEILTKLIFLTQQAHKANISITLDAEESERLDMSLEIFEWVFSHANLQDWHGFGLAVQAYQKRAIHVLRWLAALASHYQRIIPIRLVKGAYWDTEIKKTQENGLSGYPVFSQKVATDVAYLACAKFLLANPGNFYPQFATHNAHTVAAILLLGKQHPGFEIQRLHGMGERLHKQILRQKKHQIPCRIYAPVGNFQHLLPYLVRRLLENGANTSFINQIENPAISVDDLSADPVASIHKNNQQPRSN